MASAKARGITMKTMVFQHNQSEESFESKISAINSSDTLLSDQSLQQQEFLETLSSFRQGGLRRNLPDDQSEAEESFNESDFKLPDLENNIVTMNLLRQKLEKKQKKRIEWIHKLVEEEAKTLNSVDFLALVGDEYFKPADLHGSISTSALKARRIKAEAAAELATVKQVITRKPGHHRDKMRYTTLEVIEEESTLDHPKLDSIHQKIEDLRQEVVERWCLRHGKLESGAYCNEKKRKLRAWFRELDEDRSGEVNVEELVSCSSCCCRRW